MRALYPQFVEDNNTTISGLLKKPLFVNMPPMVAAEYPYTDIGKRLAKIRTGFSDLSQKAWAEKHGFNTTQYNNWEKGNRRIPVEAAEKLSDLYGLTLDSIYRGRLDGLSEKAWKVL